MSLLRPWRRDPFLAKAESRLRRLRFEPLEDRRVLTVATVDTELDVVDLNDGMTSLREAIFTANTLDGPDTIQFDASLSGKTIFLEHGELVVEDELSIVGPGQDLLTIDAQGLSRVIRATDIPFPVSLSVSGLTITGGVGPSSGNGSGGGILGDALELDRVTVTGNSTAFGPGGGISADTLVLIDSIVTGNHTSGDGSPGGGVFTSGALRMEGSRIESNNTSGDSSDGGGVFVGSFLDPTAIERSTIRSNWTSGSFSSGGGLYSGRDFRAPTFVTSSVISGNQTRGGFSAGGGVYSRNGALNINDSSISGNSAVASRNGGPYGGGGIFGYDVFLTGSSVDGNYTLGTEAEGGGVRAGGDVTLVGSTVSNNRTTRVFSPGGGLYVSGDLEVIRSTISSNRAEGASRGGGAHVLGVASLHQSTVTGNYAAESFLGGGGLSVPNGSLTIEGSIVAGNSTSSAFGGDIASFFGDTRYSIIGDSFDWSGAPDEAQTPDENGNLVGRSFGGGEIDPVLGPLANHGGPTQTHAPLAGSPAIDMGDPGFVPTARSIAMAGTATQSSTYVPFFSTEFEHSPYRAIDGELNIGFSNTEPAITSPIDTSPSWRLGFTSDYFFEEVVLHNEMLNVLDYNSLMRDITVEVLGVDGAVLFTSELLNPENVLGGGQHRKGPALLTVDLVAETGGAVQGRAIRVSRTPDPDLSGTMGFGNEFEQNALLLEEVEVFGFSAADQRGGLYSRVVGGRIDIGSFEVQPQHADFDGDGDVDLFDMLAQQRGFGTAAPDAVKADGDADGDLDVDADDQAAALNALGAGSLPEDTAPMALAGEQPVAQASGLENVLLMGAEKATAAEPVEVAVALEQPVDAALSSLAVDNEPAVGAPEASLIDEDEPGELVDLSFDAWDAPGGLV